MRYLLIIFVVVIFTSCKTTNLFMEPKKERIADTISLDSTFYYNPDYQYTQVGYPEGSGHRPHLHCICRFNRQKTILVHGLDIASQYHP